MNYFAIGMFVLLFLSLFLVYKVSDLSFQRDLYLNRLYDSERFCKDNTQMVIESAVDKCNAKIDLTCEASCIHGSTITGGFAPDECQSFCDCQLDGVC